MVEEDELLFNGLCINLLMEVVVFAVWDWVWIEGEWVELWLEGDLLIGLLFLEVEEFIPFVNLAKTSFERLAL